MKLLFLMKPRQKSMNKPTNEQLLERIDLLDAVLETEYKSLKILKEERAGLMTVLLERFRRSTNENS